MSTTAVLHMTLMRDGMGVGGRKEQQRLHAHAHMRMLSAQPSTSSYPSTSSRAAGLDAYKFLRIQSYI